MRSTSQSKFAFFLCAIFLLSTPIASAKDIGRKISSISPPSESKSSGQGPSMLKSVTQTSPGFLKPSAKGDERIRVNGFCRDNYGYTYPSGSKKYIDCVDNRSRLIGNSINNYYGPAQRGAGVGIILTE